MSSDWGEVNDDQAAVSKAMHEKVVELNASFIVSVGDNFYPAGVSSVTDPQWKATFEDRYARDVTWKVTLGTYGLHRFLTSFRDLMLSVGVALPFARSP